MVAAENQQGRVQLLRSAVPAREINYGSRCSVGSGGQNYERKRSPGLQGVQHQKKIPPPHGMGILYGGFSREEISGGFSPFTLPASAFYLLAPGPLLPALL